MIISEAKVSYNIAWHSIGLKFRNLGRAEVISICFIQPLLNTGKATRLLSLGDAKYKPYKIRNCQQYNIEGTCSNGLLLNVVICLSVAGS